MSTNQTIAAAIAAPLLIIAGIAIGRFTAPQPEPGLTEQEAIALAKELFGIPAQVDPQEGAPTATNRPTTPAQPPEPKGPPTLEIGQEFISGQLRVKPLDCWHGTLTYKADSLFGSDRTVTLDKPALILAVEVANLSEGQVFAPVLSVTDPWRIGDATDEYNNESSIQSFAQYHSWPISDDDEGTEPTDLKPGESTTLVFIVKEPTNPSAKQYRWNIRLTKDNQHKGAYIQVPTSPGPQNRSL